MKTGKGDGERETAGVRQEERDMERDTRKQRCRIAGRGRQGE